MGIIAQGANHMKFKTAEDRRDFFVTYVAVHELELRRYLWKNVNDYHLVDDLTQTIMEKAWKNLHQLKSSKTAKSWVFQIATNVLTDQFRRDASRPVIITFDYEEENPLNNIEFVEQSALDAVISNFEVSSAKRALSYMKPDEVHMIRMRYLDLMSQKEMAREFAMKSGTFSSKLCRVVKKFKKVYKLVENGEKHDTKKSK